MKINPSELVGKLAEAKIGAGVWVLRKELYPIKVDRANRITVLDKKYQIRPGAAVGFSKENKVTSKVAYLWSKRQSAKAYRLIVIYLTRGSGA